ncbi:MAG: hypothetical protein EA424_06290 [Planctomycetaceae bacterium]|nr:MAG: hypothetical protein EA424_06290 [Planctomycetaceae bacterium]
MNTTIDVQLHYGGKWLPAELIMGQDGMPRVLVAGETEGRDPSSVFYLRSDGETDEKLLAAASLRIFWPVAQQAAELTVDCSTTFFASL